MDWRILSAASGAVMDRTDSRIDLNLFRVLDAIYTYGGVSAAARVLHLTQPAVTHALKRLRDHLGDPLFVRQGNRLLPTEKVRTMMPPCKCIWKDCMPARMRNRTSIPRGWSWSSRSVSATFSNRLRCPRC
jgi:hypothetical protein